MSIEIDIATDATSRAAVQPLLSAVWPPEIVRTQPWGHLAFADPDLRVTVEEDGDVLSHVGIVRRTGTWNGRQVTIGGITSVATRADMRRRGYASLALTAAIHTLTEERATDFGLLFCEPELAAFYEARGWQSFNGQLYAELPGGRERFDLLLPYMYKIRRLLREGTIDICGLPW